MGSEEQEARSAEGRGLAVFLTAISRIHFRVYRLQRACSSLSVAFLDKGTILGQKKEIVEKGGVLQVPQ